MSASLLFFGCRGKEEAKDSIKRSEENKVNLTVDRQTDSLESPLPTAADTQVETTVLPDVPVSTGNAYLSGRTELLALPYGKRSKPEGFIIGNLYNKSESPEQNRIVISICESFFTALREENFSDSDVLERRRGELRDYWEYYLKGKFQFEEIIFAEPRKVGREMEVSFSLLPGKRTGRFYVMQKSGKWLVAGLEMDLRGDFAPSSAEKWAPSLKAQPLGY